MLDFLKLFKKDIVENLTLIVEKPKPVKSKYHGLTARKLYQHILTINYVGGGNLVLSSLSYSKIRRTAPFVGFIQSWFAFKCPKNDKLGTPCYTFELKTTMNVIQFDKILSWDINTTESIGSGMFDIKTKMDQTNLDNQLKRIEAKKSKKLEIKE